MEVDVLAMAATKCGEVRIAVDNTLCAGHLYVFMCQLMGAKSTKTPPVKLFGRNAQLAEPLSAKMVKFGHAVRPAPQRQAPLPIRQLQ